MKHSLAVIQRSDGFRRSGLGLESVVNEPDRMDLLMLGKFEMALGIMSKIPIAPSGSLEEPS